MAVVNLEVAIDVPREIETESKSEPGNDGRDDVEAETGLPHQPKVRGPDLRY